MTEHTQRLVNAATQRTNPRPAIKMPNIRGSKECGCGKTIAANKAACFGCSNKE